MFPCENFTTLQRQVVELVHLLLPHRIIIPARSWVHRAQAFQLEAAQPDAEAVRQQFGYVCGNVELVMPFVVCDLVLGCFASPGPSILVLQYAHLDEILHQHAET